MWHSDDMFRYMFEGEFVAVGSQKVPSGRELLSQDLGPFLLQNLNSISSSQACMQSIWDIGTVKKKKRLPTGATKSLEGGDGGLFHCR